MPQPTIAVKDKDGNNVTINTINPNGLTTAANSQPVCLPTDAILLPDFTGSGNITTQNLNPNSGVATAGSTVAVSTLNNVCTVGIQVTGTYTGALTVQGTIDGSNWIAIPAVRRLSTNASAATIASATQDIFTCQCAGFSAVRVSANAAVTGTAVVTMRVSSQPTEAVVNAPLPTGANTIGALSANQSVNCAQMNGVAVTMGNGVAGTGVQRVCVASDNTAFPISSISTSVTPGTAATNLGKARDSAIGATDTGVAILGVRRDTPTAETPAAGDYVVPQVSANGEQWVLTIGAPTTHHLISAASTNATSVKASAGTVNHIVVNNINAAVRYFKLYNKASAPTVGTDTPVLTLAIPAGGTVSLDLGSRGLRLGTGIAYALTTGITVADTGAVAASEHAVHISYE